MNRNIKDILVRKRTVKIEECIGNVYLMGLMVVMMRRKERRRAGWGFIYFLVSYNFEDCMGINYFLVFPLDGR